MFVPLPPRLAKLDLSQLLAAHAGLPAGKPPVGRALPRRRFPGGIQGLTAVVATVVVVGTGATVWRIHAASPGPNISQPAARALASVHPVSPSASVPPAPASSSSGAPGGLPVIAIVTNPSGSYSLAPAALSRDFSAGPTTVRLLRPDGTDVNTLTLQAGVRFLTAAGQRIFLLEPGGVLKSISVDGTVET